VLVALGGLRPTTSAIAPPGRFVRDCLTQCDQQATKGDGVMKIIVALLMLNSITGSRAVAGDSREALRNALTICNQFVIQDPDPGILLNELRDRSVLRNRIRDCNIDIWQGIDR
jgi:hypothetical protein